jgi:hypothetical protein
MKRLVIVLGLAALLFGGLAMPAWAVVLLEAPGQVCKSQDNPDDGRPLPFVIASNGGCASSVAQGFPESYVLTNAAFIAQCKVLEGGVTFPDGSEFVLEYPYAFYGNPDYLAKNRADCKYFLSSFHYGLLSPGPGGE